MKKYLFFFFILLSGVIYSQKNVPFEEKNFASNKEGYKMAMDSIAAGDKIAKQGTQFMYLAVHYYLAAEKINPDNDMLNYVIGKCLLSYNSPFKTDALHYLQKAYTLTPDIEPDIHYLLGRAYHLNMEWEKAKQEYGFFLLTLNAKKDADLINDVKKKTDECNNGEQLMKQPVHVQIDNLGLNINTQYAEYSPMISADESEIIFTSRRPSDNEKIDPAYGQYPENIYISYFKNGSWTPAENMGASINTENSDNASPGISNDGQTLFLYRGNNGGDIYESHLQGLTWTTPEHLNSKINTPYHETSVSLGPNARTLYFVSDRPGGFGGSDIYKSVMDSNNQWQDAENLGSVINTQYDEDGVYIHPDGKTLYFSSQGHNTMGGFDIFKSVYRNGAWSVPENLGYPINTPDDDIYFSVSASGKHMYFSSIRKGGYGEKDIYMVTFSPQEKTFVQSNEDNLLAGEGKGIADAAFTSPVSANSPKITLLKGIITDSATHKPLQASIELVDNTKNEIIADFRSNSSTGKYLVSLPSGINYGIAVKAEGFLFYSANFDIPDTAGFNVVEKNVALQPLEVGSSIALRNIFFDFGKASLSYQSTRELDRVIELLATHPNLKIQISGYTDNIGTDEINQKLSEERARTVVSYLVAHGISSLRLTAKGYGKQHPVASNETDEGRQLNRRTEFTITGK